MNPNRTPFACGIWLVLVLILSACSRPPALQPLSPDAVILAFGNSLTRGTGASAAKSYPHQLALLTGHTVINAGVPGELSAEGRKRLPALLEKYQPELVLLCHGGNDLIRRLDPDQLADNLKAMVAASREAGAQAVLLAVPDFGLLMSAADVYTEVAQSTGVPVETEAIPRVIRDRELKSDPIHPNGQGYAQVAEAVFRFLQEEGAL
ncbi:MAG: GDSL-type esterase/lipase family protein [Pseudomonadota bacterium]